MKNNKFYVTTPIYYVNANPHLGTLYSTLLADISARWNKILGKEVFFLTGLDEHGQKVGEAAEKAGKSPQEFVDAMVPKFKDVWNRYDFQFDHFVRTTDASHKAAVVALIEKLKEKGDIYKSSYVGYYCTPCETFIAPHLVDKDKPECPSCGRGVHEVEEESYFFRLSAYQDRLIEFYKNNPDFAVPKERLNEVISFVESGLKDLSISRKSVKWGIPFPGDAEHTVYVWGDALTNYISAIGFGSDDNQKNAFFEKWWPADLHIMAKDIFRFHAVYWPAMLMSVGLALPKRELVHGYLLMDGLKMSKSLGNVIDPVMLADWYGHEQVRYYLARHMAVTQDGSITLKEIENCINADLANNLGNLLNRMITLATRNDIKTVTPAETWEADSAYMRERCEEAFRDFWDEMNHFHYHIALTDLCKFTSEINAYFHSQEPWKVAKHNKELFAEIISVVCHCLYSVGILLWPVMPKKMEALLAALGCEFDLEKHNYADELRKNVWDKIFTLVEPTETLFSRPELHSNGGESNCHSGLDPEISRGSRRQSSSTSRTKKTEKLNNNFSDKVPLDPGLKPGVTNVLEFDDFVKVELRVGLIKAGERVEKSEKLLKLTVDLGEGHDRQILAGIAKYYAPEDLVSRKAIFVANLKPRKMMGMLSEGMLMCTQNPAGEHKALFVDDSVEPGTRAS